MSLSNVCILPLKRDAVNKNGSASPLTAYLASSCIVTLQTIVNIIFLWFYIFVFVDSFLVSGINRMEVNRKRLLNCNYFIKINCIALFIFDWRDVNQKWKEQCNLCLWSSPELFFLLLIYRNKILMYLLFEFERIFYIHFVRCGTQQKDLSQTGRTGRAVTELLRSRHLPQCPALLFSVVSL